jgi:hypothetical protein
MPRSRLDRALRHDDNRRCSDKVVELSAKTGRPECGQGHVAVGHAQKFPGCPAQSPLHAGYVVHEWARCRGSRGLSASAGARARPEHRSAPVRRARQVHGSARAACREHRALQALDIAITPEESRYPRSGRWSLDTAPNSSPGRRKIRPGSARRHMIEQWPGHDPSGAQAQFLACGPSAE